MRVTRGHSLPNLQADGLFSRDKRPLRSANARGLFNEYEYRFHDCGHQKSTLRFDGSGDMKRPRDEESYRALKSSRLDSLSRSLPVNLNLQSDSIMVAGVQVTVALLKRPFAVFDKGSVR